MVKRLLIDNCLSIAFQILPEIVREKNHFTFIIDKNRILSIGVNSSKTHTEAVRLGYRFPSIHSELAALLKLPYGTDTHKCNLVNIRLSRASIRYNRPILRMSKPCQYCEKWIRQMAFRNVVYSNDEGFHKL